MSSVAVSTDSKPRLSHGFRLQWEPAQNQYVLLFPEGMVKLNTSAGEILRRCTGDVSVAQITAELEGTFQRDDLGPEVTSFVTHALERQWLALSA